MITTKELLERGYFPRELPPSFTTASFAAFVASYRRGLSLPARSTQYVSHNLARPGGLRRSLKIPNPFFYLALSEQIERHGALIDSHLRATNLSASRPRATKALGRAVVPRLRLGELPKLRARRWPGARYLVLTSINSIRRSTLTAYRGLCIRKRLRRPTSEGQPSPATTWIQHLAVSSGPKRSAFQLAQTLP